MENSLYDVIIIGSGMGGISAGACLVKEGLKVLLLEKAAIPGGCSSSYKIKDAVFESGATTLIGFDEFQPLKRLEQLTGTSILKEPLDVSMRVHLDGQQLDRAYNFEAFLKQSVALFGFENEQRKFWRKALSLTKLVWQVSEKNVFFPPKTIRDWMEAAKVNSIKDIPSLKYLLLDTSKAIKSFGIHSKDFERFIDQQLMITAQAKSSQVPFLFAAPALCYPHSRNYYVRGGLWRMIYSLLDGYKAAGGELLLKQEVSEVNKVDGYFTVQTRRRKCFKSKMIVFNTPIWNTAQIVAIPGLKSKLEKQAERFERAWGAFTMGVVFKDHLPDSYPLHHQIHYRDELLGGEGSLFVSLSKADDRDRARAGHRVANISLHTEVDNWFVEKAQYDDQKSAWESIILRNIEQSIPEINVQTILEKYAATPRTWQKWVGRDKGKVGGLPQSMSRSVLDWPETNPQQGVYLVGDTTYPGQGIPGVTLSGINVYLRILDQLNSKKEYLS